MCVHVDLFHYILRTDTRIFYENKAGYTATPVACGYLRSLDHLGRSSEAKVRKKQKKKVKCDKQTDGPMD